jgi:hypothetical protein
MHDNTRLGNVQGGAVTAALPVRRTASRDLLPRFYFSHFNRAALIAAVLRIIWVAENLAAAG